MTDNTMKTANVINMSGGKDSTATLLLALEQKVENVFAIFADTGHEHRAVYDYLDALEKALDVRIGRYKADFTDRIAAKRKFIANDVRYGREYATVKVAVPGEFDESGHQIYRKKKVGGGRRVRWTNKAKRRALSVLHPTGIPFLDLCLWKGRFPSTRSRFCTDELKVTVLHQQAFNDIFAMGYERIVSWQGVRADESPSRAKLESIELEFGDYDTGAGLWNYRPILKWSAEEVFDFHRKHNIPWNPLYEQGMGRVGCMPCVNVRKEELATIASRFPEELQRVYEWEALVSMASKRGSSTLIPSSNDPKHNPAPYVSYKTHGIFAAAEWAKTARGGHQYDLIEAAKDHTVCQSVYGLC